MAQIHITNAVIRSNEKDAAANRKRKQKLVKRERLEGAAARVATLIAPEKGVTPR